MAEQKYQYALVIKINNTQNDYANAFRLIEATKRSGGLTGNTIQQVLKTGIKEISWLSLSAASSVSRIIKAAVSGNGLKKLGANKGDKFFPKEPFAYVFIVGLSDLLSVADSEKADSIDIVNLQYLVTAWQSYAGELFIYLNNDSDDPNAVISTYHKLSQYLYFAITGDKAPDSRSTEKGSPFYNALYACYCSKKKLGIDDKLSTKKIQRLQLQNLDPNILKKFLPILRIDKRTDALLGESVRSAYKDGLNQVFSFEGEEVECPLRDILSKLNETVKSDGSSAMEQAFKRICLNYLMLAKPQNHFDENFSRESFDDLFGDMSMLAFYIYCTFLYFSKQEPDGVSLGKAAQRQKFVSDVQDYASGIIELVDNVVRHSALHSGFLGIRIHSGKQIGVSSGLRTRCLNYFSNRTIDDYYLEVCITDTFFPRSEDARTAESDTRCIMIKKFLENLNKRREYQPKELAQIEEFKNAFKNAALRDFFAPADKEETAGAFSIKNWDKYYSITSNILYHYGLMQFSSIIKSRNGYFKVISSDSFHIMENCRYCTEEDHTSRGEEFCVPGTQYSIVLPIKLKIEQYATGFSAPSSKIDFLALARLRQEPCSWCTKSLLDELAENSQSSDDVMAQASQAFSKELEKHLVVGDAVYTFDWCEFDIRHREMFLKGLFYYVDSTRNERNKMAQLRMAICGCTFAALLHCVELFTAFYNRYSEQEAMRFVDVYMVSKDCRYDFLLSGKNLGIAVARSEQMAAARGRFTLLNTIFAEKLWPRSLENHSKQTPAEDESDAYVPYDMLLKVDGGTTVFYKAVRDTLMADIQGEEFGCLVRDAHVRVGSKIHVAEQFFEAQELFHTPHYLLRFADAIADQVFNALRKKNRGNPKNIILLGYETYSELLVIAVEKAIRARIARDRIWREQIETQFKIDRVIYENSAKSGEATLRHGIWQKHPLSSETTDLVLIVPINSTLSTHNKIWGKLKNTPLFSEISSPAYNIGVILIRTGNADMPVGMERRYWKTVNTVEKYIETKHLIDPEVHYLISVESRWRDPLKCEFCYPPDDPKLERPLVETNKASVIPSQMIGLQKREPVPQRRGADFPTSAQRLKPWLTPAIMACDPTDAARNWKGYRYGHFECAGNHFQFYFDTEAILESIDKDPVLKRHLDKWMEEKRNELFPKDAKTETGVYHILVIPEHQRNARWVDKVVNQMFNNEPYVLRFNIMKEYRDNIKTKYSNITTLYKNLREAGKNAVIKFHFLDCTISSGRTLERAMTLMRSLFPEEAFSDNKDGDQKVRVNLFESILLFLSRMSPDSKRGYAGNGKFFSYIDLHISQLRNHEDACVLCNLEKQYKSLASHSATDRMATHWLDKARLHGVKSIETYESETEAWTEKLWKDGRAKRPEDWEMAHRKAEQAYRRLWCSETAFEQLSLLGYGKNDTDQVEERIWQMINARYKELRTLEEKAEYLISFAKVFSRPFLTFRKSVMEASFRFRLNLLTVLIEGTPPSEEMKRTVNYVEQLSKRIQDKKVNRERFAIVLTLIRTLAGSLSKNGSNYMIRKGSYSKLFSYIEMLYQKLLGSPAGLESDKQWKKIRSDFVFWYIATVKRQIETSGDETKCLWLEALLLQGQEWRLLSEEKDMAFLEKFGIDSSFGQCLYMENTRILFDGICDLHRNAEKEEIIRFVDGNASPPYYLENFVKFISGNYASNFEPVSLTIPRGSVEEREIKGMLGLYDKLSKRDQDYQESQQDENPDRTSQFYKVLVEDIWQASGAASVRLLGEVSHFDRYAAVKEEIERKAEDASGKLSSKREMKNFTDGLRSLTKIERRRELYEITCGPSSISIENSANERELKWLSSVVIDTDPEKFQMSSFLLRTEAGGKGLAVLKISEAGFSPVYICLMFCFEKETSLLEQRYRMLRGARNVLTFHNTLLKQFKRDLSNDLMPNYIQAKSNTFRLSRKRGWGHADDHKIRYIWRNLADSEPNSSYATGQMLYAYADQMCGHLYIEYVQRQDKPIYSEYVLKQDKSVVSGKGGNEDTTPVFEYAELKKLANIGRYRERANVIGRNRDIELEFVFLEQEKVKGVKVLGDDLKIVTALLLLGENALKHAAAKTVNTDEGGAYATVNLYIRRDGKYLVVSNRMARNLESTSRSKVETAQSRLNHIPENDSGISLWTINQYVKDVLLRYTWECYQRELQKAKARKRILSLSKDLLDRIRELDRHCIQIDMRCGDPQGGVSDYEYEVIDEEDNDRYLINAYFEIKLPIILEEK